MAKLPEWSPFDVGIEQALLGAVLMNNDAHGLVSRLVTVDDFYEGIHQKIWEVATQLIEAGKPASPLTIRVFLQEFELLEGITTSQYLAKLAAGAVTVVNAPDFAKIIRELADRRRLADIGRQLVPTEATGAAQMAAEAIEALDAIVTASAPTGAPAVDMRQAMARAVEASAQAYQNDGHIVGIPTTLRDLDAKTGGMSRGDLVILAGRPGMGKSAAMLTMLRRQAEQGFSSMLVSLEMSDVPMSHRMISDAIFDLPGDNIPYTFLRSGRFHEKLFEVIRETAAALAELPIRIEQQPGLTVSQIAARARQLKRKRGLDILAVDHLDLVKASGRYAGNKVYELGEITAALKALAKELDIVVILLCQLSREVEKREDKRPQLSDLRSSGSIEQDADTVIFLYREAYYLANAEPAPATPEYLEWQNKMVAAHNKLMAIIAKQRMGPTGSVELFCDIGSNAIRDISNDYGPGRN